MKKYILVLALVVTSFGAFSQGFGDLKKAAKDVDVEAVKTAVDEKTGDASTAKGSELTEKVAKAINVDKEKVDAAAKVATSAVKNVTADKVEKIKKVADDKVADIKAEKTEEAKAVEENSVSATDLKSETTEKKALKDEKKANLLAKITSLGTKITGAESKLGLLKESGASEEEVSKKSAIIDAAKAKLAKLTASFK